MLYPRTWILTDDRPGNRTQAIGVADKLGWEYEEKRVSYNRFAALPNFLLGASLRGICDDSSAIMAPPWPDVTIAAGRRLVPLMRYLKKRNPDNFSCYLMHPQAFASDFDLLAIPQHDAPAPADNVIVTLGAPHRLTAQTLKQAAEDWRGRFDGLPRPHIALLLGGDCAGGHFTDDDWYRIASDASVMACSNGGSLLVSTSRRTSARGIDVVRLAISEPNFMHIWQRDGANPYHAMLATADAIVVSGESMSMCSEACAIGKPVFVYSSRNSCSNKHLQLHKQLYDGGYARSLTATASLDWTPPAILDEAGRIAEKIREKLEI